MLRQAHYLKHNVRSESPSQCIFFDTETNSTDFTPDKKRLDLSFGMACYVRLLARGKWSAGDWFTFNTPGELWTWVDSKIRHKSKVYMFAHNLIFDFTVAHGFSELPKLGYHLTKAIVDDPPTVLQFTKQGKSICLVDTFNYFKSSLAELGKSIGLDKLSMPDAYPEPMDYIEQCIDESERAVTGEPSCSELWEAYTQRDVEIIKQAMLSYLEFIKVNDMGNFQLTIASQAFTAYRHRFMPVKIFIDDNKKALELARASYHGGRTEAFFIGELTGDFYLVDVNSMYPFVMSLVPYPTVLIGVYNRVKLSELSQYLQNFSCIADVTVRTDEPVYPAASKDGLLFPVGKFRTALTTPHLSYGLANEHILRVHRVAVYQRTMLFSSYVYALYRLKEDYQTQGNKAFETMAKYLLNTLYGKFGQAGRVYKDIGEAEPESIKSWVEIDAETHEITRLREFGGIVQAWYNESESFNSHPAISSHVTAYAQALLWELMRAAGIDNVYYCDTDSLVVNKEGYDSLMDQHSGSGLGELKLEKQFSHLVIYTLKDYIFDDMVKRKGIRKNAIEIMPGLYEQDRFGKFKTMLRDGDLDTMTITKQVKYLRRDYRKGIVTESGRVRPFVYPDEDDYHRWLDKQHEAHLVYGSSDFDDIVDPQFKMAIVQDDLDARRSKSMIYQRRGK